MVNPEEKQVMGPSFLGPSPLRSLSMDSSPWFYSRLFLGLIPASSSCWIWFHLDSRIPTRTSLLFWMDFNLVNPHGWFPLMALVFPMVPSLPHGLVPLVHTWTSQPQGLGPLLGLGLLFGTRFFHRNYACQHYRFGSTNIQIILNA